MRILQQTSHHMKKLLTLTVILTAFFASCQFIGKPIKAMETLVPKAGIFLLHKKLSWQAVTM
jgi:hypothetical protein